MPEPMYLTREGLAKLRAELEHLRTAGRADAAERIHLSRERGGTAGNAEYEEARDELAFIEGRILTLDNILGNAVLIEEGPVAGDTVHIGSTVRVKNQSGKTFQYTIIGSAEADPSRGRISNVSPFGRSLLGKRVGEVTEVNAPSGKIQLEVLSIE